MNKWTRFDFLKYLNKKGYLFPELILKANNRMHYSFLILMLKSVSVRVKPDLSAL